MKININTNFYFCCASDGDGTAGKTVKSCMKP